MKSNRKWNRGNRGHGNDNYDVIETRRHRDLLFDYSQIICTGVNGVNSAEAAKEEGEEEARADEHEKGEKRETNKTRWQSVFT